MELPTFHRVQEKWRDFWDEFHNALEKDLSLTSTDKFHYLRSSNKNEEVKDIVATGSRGGKDYDTIVLLLKNRYDRPRETCRIVVQK